MPLTSVKRWSKDEKAKIAVPCPSLIAAYNQHMGGIDLSDMLVHLYKTPAKSQRWYFPMFGYVLDLCISNAWLVYKRDWPTEGKTNASQKISPGCGSQFETSQQGSTQSWQTIICLSTTNVL